MSPRHKWTASEVLDVLRGAYGIDRADLHSEEWSLHTEVPLRSPYPKGHPLSLTWKVRSGDDRHRMNERSIDALLVRNWSGGTGHERIAVEIKVSRSDYRNETDDKRAPAEHAAHRCTYAAPAGLIDPETLPPGWGLIEVYETPEACAEGEGRLLGTDAATDLPRARWRVRASRREPDCDMDYLVAALARPGSRALERLRRGATEVADPAVVPNLRAEIDRLTGMLERREQALERETKRAKAARSELLALDGITECADCGGPITYARGGVRDTMWVHRDPLAEKQCRLDRTEANRRDREAATGAAYLTGWPDPVEPKPLRTLRLAQAAEDTAADAG